MTSTNDGKDVKSNQTSGTKGKSFYIELYKSLEAGLSKDSDLSERTQTLCDAWRRIHSLCAHSAASTHPHLLSWLQRHTARTVLQTEWQDPENKKEHKRLEEAIDDFIKESQSNKDGEPPWQTQLVARGEWFKRILENPWGHPVLRVLLDPKRKESPKDEEVLEWLKEERGVMFVTRLRQLASSKHCKDLALELASGILNRVRACMDPPKDDQVEEPKENEKNSGAPTFIEILKAEAGFTVEVMELLTDIEFVLLHKRDNVTRCIELAKQTPLRNGYQLVERLQSRQETSPREKKLWKNAKDVATLIAQVVIARCMVVGVCAGVSRTALYCCARSLARLLGAARLAPAAAALAAPAATARHLHTLALAVDSETKDDMKPFVCELYVRAITAGMNELERLKLNADKEAEARSSEQTLSQWFVQLGAVLAASERMRCECTLTAFSVHPTPTMYEKIKAAPDLPPVALDIEPKGEQTTSEFGSWASDSRSQTNFVKTSETLKLKQTQHQANVLSTAILTEGEALHLSPELCQDIAVLLSGPRVKTLSWDMDRQLLLENCRTYMERTHFGTRALTTELKYLNLDLRQYQHLPEEDEDDSDMYYGIEKGYEHLVEFQEPEEIWEDAEDFEKTESAHSTDIETEIALVKSKKKSKKILTSSGEEDPLSVVAEAKRVTKKKERPHSKERSKVTKSKIKTNLRDPLEINDHTTDNNSTDKITDHSIERLRDHSVQKKKVASNSNQKKDHSTETNKDPTKKKRQSDSTEKKKELKDTDKKKEKKERKRKEKSTKREHKSTSLSSLVGIKVTNMDDKNKSIKLTTTPDGYYDNEACASINSLLSDGNETDVLFDGLFCMDELQSPEKTLDKSKKMNLVRNIVTQNMVNGTISRGTPDNTKIDINRVSTPTFSGPSTESSPSKTTVNEDIKKSITKLIQFRRQKALSESPEQRNLLTNPNPQTYRNKNSKTQGSQPQVCDSKIFMKKSHAEKLAELKNEVTNILNNKDYMSQCNQSQNLGNTVNRIKILNSTALQPPLQKPSTSKEFKTSSKTLEMLNRQNIRTDKHKSHQKIFNDFLADLQVTINAGTGMKTNCTPPSNNEIKTINRVNPVLPTSEPKVTQSAKPSLKKSEIAPNTFSRLSYYKSNNNHIKTKRLVEAIMEHQSQQLEKIRNGELDRVIAEHNLAKIKYLNSSGQTVIKPTKSSDNVQKVSQISLCKSRENPMSGLLHGSTNLAKTSVIQNIQPNIHKPRDNVQSKIQNIPPNVHKPRDNIQSQIQNIQPNIHKPQDNIPTQIQNIQPNLHKPRDNIQPKIQNKQPDILKRDNIHHNILKPRDAPKPQQNKLSALTEKDQQDLVLLLRQQSKQNLTRPRLETPQERMPPPSPSSASNICNITNLLNKRGVEVKSVNNPNKMKSTSWVKPSNEVRSVSKSIVKTEQTHKHSEETALQKVIDSEIKSVQTKVSSQKQETAKQTDWESVMDALLKHKTPSRGPNALDMALNKDTYLSAYENSLQNETIFKLPTDPCSESDAIQTQETSKSNTDCSGNTTKILRQSNTDIKKYNNYKSKQSSKAQKVIAHPPLEKQTSSTSTLGLPSDQHSKVDKSKKIVTDRRQRDVYTTPKRLKPELKKHQFTCPLPKEDDPFISGNLNSDYDLLEELIDDDLRQEIGELLSDEDSYNAPSQSSKDTKVFIGINKTSASVIQENKQCVEPSVNLSFSQTNLKKPTQRLPCHNVPKPVMNTQTKLQQATAYVNVNTVPNHMENVNVQNISHIQTDNIIHEIPKSVIITPKKELNYVNTVTTVDQTFVALPQQTALQNVVLIGSELVYQPCVQTPLLTSAVPNTYVAFNTQPNIAVYQTTQFAAPVVNPLIIGNAITTPTVPVDVSTTKIAHSPLIKVSEVKPIPITTSSKVSKVKPIPITTMSKVSEVNPPPIITSIKVSNVNPPPIITSTKVPEVNAAPITTSTKVSEVNSPLIITEPIKFDVKKPDAREDNKKSVDYTIQDNSSTKEKSDINVSKNCERKVLSEVQEKQKNCSTDIDSKPQRAPFENDVMKSADHERLNRKRMAIMNRNIYHRSDNTPIPLTYTPLKMKKPEVTKTQEKYHNLRSAVKAAARSSEVCLNVDTPINVKTETLRTPESFNVKEVDTNENSKENKNKSSCRILLRSSNKLKTDKLMKSLSVKTKPKKTKVKLKNTSGTANYAKIKSKGNNNINKKRALKNKTIKNVILTKRITRQTRKNVIAVDNIDTEKKSKDEGNVDNFAEEKSKETNETTELVHETPDLLDIEDQIIGSKILKKSCNPIVINIPKTLNQRDESVDSDKHASNNSHRDESTDNLLPELDYVNIPVAENIACENSSDTVNAKAAEIDKNHQDNNNEKLIDHGREKRSDSPYNEKGECSDFGKKENFTKLSTLCQAALDNTPQELSKFTADTKASEISWNSDVFTEKKVKTIEKSESKKSTAIKTILKSQGDPEVICLDDDKTKPSMPFKIDPNIPQSFLDAIKVEELNPDPTDPIKKCVRIKLPNGRAFKATVRGQSKVNIETLFGDATLRKVFLSNISNNNICTLNIKQISTSNKVNPDKILETRIQTISVQPPRPLAKVEPSHCMETINLLSDDEEESFQYFHTEFGKFKIPRMKRKLHESHQKIFDKKCAVKLKKVTPQTSNITSSMLNAVNGPEVETIVPDMITTDSTPDTVALTNTAQQITQDREIIEIDDSSNDDQNFNDTIVSERDNKIKTCEEKILEFKNLLLKDLGVEETDDNLTTVSTHTELVEEQQSDLIIQGNLTQLIKETLNEIIVPDTDLSIGNTLSDGIIPRKSPKSLCSMADKKCFVKLINCDDLVEKYNHIKECSIELIRCDDNLYNATYNKSKNTIDVNATLSLPTSLVSENYYEEMIMSPQPLSRSGSISILNDCDLLDQPLLSEDYSRCTSPVMDAYEAFAAFRNRKLDDKVTMDRQWKCETEWYLSKSLIWMQNKIGKVDTQNTENKDNVSDTFEFSSNTSKELNKINFEEPKVCKIVVPNLVAILTKYFQDSQIVNKCCSMYKPISSMNPSHNLKRKSLYNTSKAGRISKKSRNSSHVLSHNASISSDDLELSSHDKVFLNTKCSELKSTNKDKNASTDEINQECKYFANDKENDVIDNRPSNSAKTFLELLHESTMAEDREQEKERIIPLVTNEVIDTEISAHITSPFVQQAHKNNSQFKCIISSETQSSSVDNTTVIQTNTAEMINVNEPFHEVVTDSRQNNNENPIIIEITNISTIHTNENSEFNLYEKNKLKACGMDVGIESMNTNDALVSKHDERNYISTDLMKNAEKPKNCEKMVLNEKTKTSTTVSGNNITEIVNLEIPLDKDLIHTNAIEMRSVPLSSQNENTASTLITTKEKKSSNKNLQSITSQVLDNTSYTNNSLKEMRDEIIYPSVFSNLVEPSNCKILLNTALQAVCNAVVVATQKKNDGELLIDKGNECLQSISVEHLDTSKTCKSKESSKDEFLASCSNYAKDQYQESMKKDPITEDNNTCRNVLNTQKNDALEIGTVTESSNIVNITVPSKVKLTTSVDQIQECTEYVTSVTISTENKQKPFDSDNVSSSSDENVTQSDVVNSIVIENMAEYRKSIETRDDVFISVSSKLDEIFSSNDTNASSCDMSEVSDKQNNMSVTDHTYTFNNNITANIECVTSECEVLEPCENTQFCSKTSNELIIDDLPPVLIEEVVDNHSDDILEEELAHIILGDSASQDFQDSKTDVTKNNLNRNICISHKKVDNNLLNNTEDELLKLLGEDCVQTKLENQDISKDLTEISHKPILINDSNGKVKVEDCNHDNDIISANSDEKLEESLEKIVLGSNNEKSESNKIRKDLFEILDGIQTPNDEFIEQINNSEIDPLTLGLTSKSKTDHDLKVNTDLFDESCSILDAQNDCVEDIVELRSSDELEQELARIVLGSANSDDDKQILIINADNLEFDEVKVCCIQQSELQRLIKIENKGKSDEHIEYRNQVIGASNLLLDDDEFNQLYEDILQITQEIDEYGNVKEIDIRLNVPRVTYSRRTMNSKLEHELFGDKRNRKSLKRKGDMADVKAPERKYRKGKNIDTPKLTAATIAATAYTKEFKRLFDYCSSIKFSYSRPFHKEQIDVDQILMSWPITECFNTVTDLQIDENLFIDADIVTAVQRDPLNQTLAEEIETEYNEGEYSSCHVIETNFQMGFGEGSGRVIQNLEDDSGKFSAATLSDVKQTQPLLLSENYNYYNSVQDVNNIDKAKKEKETLKRNYRCIQLKDKIRTFFKDTMIELNNDWIKQNKKHDDIYLNGYRKASNFSFPFGLNLPDFIKPPPVEVVIQVVQVGQLPVSAAAQNPMTCDPRVTQVSDASPSQCTAENSPNDDPQSAIKTEYTELTTADISLPLQDYAQHHNQQLLAESQNSSNIIMHHDFIIEEIKEEIKEEIEEPEMSDEACDQFETAFPNNQFSPSGNCIIENVDYSYEGSAPPQPTKPTLVGANMGIVYSSTKTQENIETPLQQYHQTPLQNNSQEVNIMQRNSPMPQNQQFDSTQHSSDNSTQFLQLNPPVQAAQQDQHSLNPPQNSQIQLSHQTPQLQQIQEKLSQKDQNDHIEQNNFSEQLPHQNQQQIVQQKVQTHTKQKNEQDQIVSQNHQTHIAKENDHMQIPQQGQQTQAAQESEQAQITHQNPQDHITQQAQAQTQQTQLLQQEQQVQVGQQQTHSLQVQLSHQNLQTQVTQQNHQEHNSLPEKTDQIAHAMNAAGITTTTETLAETKAHALVNILSQKLRPGSIGCSSTNTYPKTTQINTMALQHALAQILPPPLNQTNVENNHTNSTSTPQVLHIVQGKNASGSQITLVENSQSSVINTPNTTPVLHIVQNKCNASVPTSNGTASPQTNSFSGLSLVDAGLQQGNQLLHIVNTGNQKNASAGQLLRKVNLLTNLTNVQGSNEQKMVQFVCKSADGKSIQLNSPHPRGMVLRLQPVESPNLQLTQTKPIDSQESSSPSSTSNNNKETGPSQQEIKSRSIYEENYAKFIQSSNKTTAPEKATSLPKFGQAFGKQVFQEGTQKTETNNSNSHLQSNSENSDSQPNDNAIGLDHITQISSPPLLVRKSPQTSQAQPNLVQQLKQTIAPVNMSMHGGVIYTRQIPVNIGGGQTINLITVPSTELIDESAPKHPTVNQDGIEPSIIKIVPQTSASSESSDENNSHIGNDSTHTAQSQPVLTQMRIKLPMLSKTPQMVGGTRLVRPSFFQIQRNVIAGTNQPVYQQLVLTAAPPLGQQTIRLPQTQTNRHVKVPSESQSSSESQMSSSTLEQLREFDLVLEQVKERSTGTGTAQPSTTPSASGSFSKLHTASRDTTDSSPSTTSTVVETTQQVLYSIGNTQQFNVTYVNKKAPSATATTSSFVRSPDSSGIVESPTSSTQQIRRTVSSDSSTADPPTRHNSHSSHASHNSHTAQHPKPYKPKSKPRPRASNTPSALKLPPAPPKTTTQKPAEDEQTTQRILYILAEYKEQVENSPDKDKPAPRRRTNPPSNPGGSSRRKKSSSGSRRSGRDMSPCHGEDTCRTLGSEDSSCGTSQGDCNESCLDSHSPEPSPRKFVRRLTFEHETAPVTQPRPQPTRNVIVADGQTITVARGTAGKPATAVLMPANYILPVSMVKGGQQIAIVTNRGPKLLTVSGGEGGATNALLLQRLIGPAGLKPVLARPGVRHVRLPTSALHNLHAFNLTTATTVQPPDSTASPAPAPTPPDLVDTRATSSPWRTERDSREQKPDRGSSPDGSEPWNLPSSDYSYEETVRSDQMDRTVLDPIPDRYSPDMEAQRIFDKMFDVDSKKSYMVHSHDDSPRCGYDIDASDCDDKAYHQVVHKKDGSHRQHRLTHVSAAALRHKYAILEHELRLQKSLSEECEDLGVDSPSASELFPEAELLFAASPAHDHTQDQAHHSHTPQPLLSQSGIPQPDMDDQIATDQLLPRSDHMHDDRDLGLGLEDVGIVTVSEDGMQATIQLDQEEFARSHPNTTFHSEPTDGEEVQQSFTLSSLKSRHITSTILHSNRPQGTVLMTAPQTTVISQATAESSTIHHHNTIKYSDIDNMINSLPGTHTNNINLSSVLVKDDGLSRFDNLLNDSREIHLSNTASAIVHSSGHATQVIRRVCYEEDKRVRDNRFLMDEPDGLIAGDDAKMAGEDSSRDATMESMGGDTTGSSPEPHTELFWDSHSASGRADFSSDSDKCCKSPSDDTSTDSSAGAGVGVRAHMRLDSVIKEARGHASDDDVPPLRTYPAPRSLSGKTAPSGAADSGRRRASGRALVKRGGCLCCVGDAPPRPKKPRVRRPAIDFAAAN